MDIEKITKEQVGEIAYYIFFLLMVFAKAVGMDSGNNSYLYISAVALVALALKLVLTRYTKVEMIAMGVVTLIAAFAYYNSGRMGIVLTVCMLIGMKDISAEKLFRLAFIVFGIFFLLTVIPSMLGLTLDNAMLVQQKGNMKEVIRWGMGYSTANIFHLSFFILLAFGVTTFWKHFNIKFALLALVADVLIYVYTLSYTGLIVTALYILLCIYFKYRRHLSTLEKTCIVAVFPGCALFSFIGSIFVKSSGFFARLDELLQARLSYGNYYLTNQPVTLFGTRMHDVPFYWVIMDNSYIYLFMTFGIVVFVGFVAAYIYASYVMVGGLGKDSGKAPVQGKYLALLMACSVYGISEQFMSNAFLNISWIPVGVCLWALLSGEKENIWDMEEVETEQTQADRESFSYMEGRIKVTEVNAANVGMIMKKLRGTAITSFLLGLVICIGFVTPSDYIEVPIKALPEVEAVCIRVVDTIADASDKKLLRKDMARFEECISEVQVSLQPEVDCLKAQDMINVHLPVEEIMAGKYTRFDVRMLKLDDAYTDEEYAQMLTELVLGAMELYQESADQGYGMLASDMQIEEQVISKDAGIDRIEHLENHDYVAYRRGAILHAENRRMLLTYGLVIMLFGIGLVLGIHVYEKRKVSKKDKK